MRTQQPTSIRLSPTAMQLRDQLAMAMGVSRSAIIELALRSLARQQRIDTKSDRKPDTGNV